MLKTRLRFKGPGMSSEIPILPGVGAVAARYDGFILDLWGVVHNGQRPLPGVLDCLDRLRGAGKSVVLLSNAPRRIESLIRRLEQIGVPRDLYDHVMSSGEATHEALAAPPDDFHRALGRHCLHMGPERDTTVYDGLDFEIVGRAEEADFVLNTGIVDYAETVADYEAALAAAAALDLPMVCANPDLVVVVGDTPTICAGALAKRYEELGGRVAYHGKPHPPVYRRCFQLMPDVDKARILAVGDSFRTDIAGANAVGIDSLLVAGGIHAGELAAGPEGGMDPAKLAAAVAETGHRPTYGGSGLIWGPDA